VDISNRIKVALSLTPHLTFGAWSFILSMEFSWLGLFLGAALGSAPDAPSVDAGAASWNVIGGRFLLAGVILSVVRTLIALVGLRPTRQSRGSAG
jgi:hypothetical protein